MSVTTTKISRGTSSDHMCMYIQILLQFLRDGDEFTIHGAQFEGVRGRRIKQSRPSAVASRSRAKEERGSRKRKVCFFARWR